jgi:hypothetical protein
MMNRIKPKVRRAIRKKIDSGIVAEPKSHPEIIKRIRLALVRMELRAVKKRITSRHVYSGGSCHECT